MLKCKNCGCIGDFWGTFFYDEGYDPDRDDVYYALKCPKCGYETSEDIDENFIEVEDDNKNNR